jgi:hypothetical protein
VIIDESDGTDDAVDRADRARLPGHLREELQGRVPDAPQLPARGRRRRTLVLSSEDLMNTPVVPLHRTSASRRRSASRTASATAPHTSAPFEYFSAKERETALREFPELYRAGPTDPCGWKTARSTFGHQRVRLRGALGRIGSSSKI